MIIIGGGAAGMAAAVFASDAGLPVDLYEKNEKTGKKLYITGKGRCNFSNICDTRDFLANVVRGGKFLQSALYGFTSYDTLDLFERLGLKTKVERGRRAFPASDHSSDVIKALNNAMKKNGVRLHLNEEIRELPDPDKENAYVIIACGGLSYPSTGSTGDGYRFAGKLGLKVNETYPALVPFNTIEEYIRQLQGLSLKNVTLTIKDGGRTLFSETGEMLFTHFGISGPLTLSASSLVNRQIKEHELQAFIDLKSALTEEQVDARLLREFDAARNKAFKNAVSSLFPAKLLPVILDISGIDADKPVHGITKAERAHFASLIKAFPFTLTSLRGYNEAVITSGGIDLKEIDPKTMEAKKAPGYYFIGETLDADALTGGYNLQIAWSTAYAAVQGILTKYEIT